MIPRERTRHECNIQAAVEMTTLVGMYLGIENFDGPGKFLVGMIAYEEGDMVVVAIDPWLNGETTEYVALHKERLLDEEVHLIRTKGVLFRLLPKDELERHGLGYLDKKLFFLVMNGEEKDGASPCRCFIDEVGFFYKENAGKPSEERTDAANATDTV